jgi:hypothetical protein
MSKTDINEGDLVLASYDGNNIRVSKVLRFNKYRTKAYVRSFSGKAVLRKTSCLVPLAQLVKKYKHLEGK